MIRLLLLLLLLSPFFSGRAAAQTLPPERIAVVVNDEVISTSDISERIKLITVSGRLPDNEETRKRLLTQVLRTLVDEKLQMQEAKRLDVTVSEGDVANALNRIAADNNTTADDLLRGLRAAGANPNSLLAQIRASIGWFKVVQRSVRPLVDVGEEEIDAVLQRQKRNVGQPEYLTSEIFLSVDAPEDETRVKQLADSLVQQLRDGGSFTALARQFSQNASASTGGDLGWIQPGQLESELDKVIGKLDAGMISSPVRSLAGFHILGVREKRVTPPLATDDPQLTLRQLYRATGPDAYAAAQAEAAKIAEAQNKKEDCSALDAALQDLPAWQSQSLPVSARSGLPEWLQNLTDPLPVGGGSAALAVDGGVTIVYVCGRTRDASAEKNRDAILQQLGLQKLELQARRVLRDLRRNAYLDVRV